MSESELVRAYSAGRIGRRVFIRGMLAAGVSLSSALGYAEFLSPAAGATSGGSGHGTAGGSGGVSGHGKSGGSAGSGTQGGAGGGTGAGAGGFFVPKRRRPDGPRSRPTLG